MRTGTARADMVRQRGFDKDRENWELCTILDSRDCTYYTSRDRTRLLSELLMIMLFRFLLSEVRA